MIDRELASFVKNLMPKERRSGNNAKPVSVWMEMDRIRGYPEQTCVAIFRTTGCSWYNFSSCSMCGYFNDISSTVTEENLMKQTDEIIHYLGNTETLKVFTSGSFLDPIEMPVRARDYFYDSISGKIDKLLVESRTEYITPSNLSPIKDRKLKARIAIGVESANDEIIARSINKGSSFNKFVTAAKTSKEQGFEVRSYLLLKPPFMSEAEAVDDCMRSIALVAPYSTDISVNPMNIQKNTLVEYLWKRGQYRPPRLWSLARILVWAGRSGFNVVSYPTGGNRERGVHNDLHDDRLLNLIVQSSLSQGFDELDKYIQASDLSRYYNDLEVENLLPEEIDYHKLIHEMSYSRISV